MLILTGVIQETRSTVILRKMAYNIQKATGDQRYRPYVPEGQEISLSRMIYISCTRPICKSTSSVGHLNFTWYF